MLLRELTALFQDLVAPDIPNEWDVEERVEVFLDWDDDRVREIFQLVPMIWPVSHALCYSYLEAVPQALRCLRPDQLFEWIGAVLDQYEQGGLREAQRYMAEVETRHLCHLRGEGGLELTRVTSRLLPYARGLAGGQMELAASPVAFTDTTTIFLPPKLEVHRQEEENFLLYRLLIAYQWGFVACGSFTPPLEHGEGVRDSAGADPLERFLAGFAEPLAAQQLYHLLETVRVGAFLARELPGLMRDSAPLRKEAGQASPADLPDGLIGRLRQAIAGDLPAGELEGPAELREFYRLARAGGATVHDSQAACRALYPFVTAEGEGCGQWEPLLFQGEMRLDAVRLARLKRREEQKNHFIEGLANLLLELSPGQRGELEEKMLSDGEPAGPEQEGATLLPARQEQGWEATGTTLFATLDNSALDEARDLHELADRIIADLGGVPQQYIASAFGRAGQAAPPGHQVEDAPQDAGPVSAPVTYDEWDFRRNGFRKKWCVLTEKELSTVRSTFLEQTLHARRGQILRLRRQFEMLRTRERFVRRQREGDDIDLDALVESLADTAAGLPPSDRLFVRLARDERDIAALFLVDMSNSTEGWVTTTIKEALILLCEAMETVGDRYAVYGFSGMRRLRCEVFHVKHFAEHLSDAVQDRICSIGPREYTRMGPAIRHATSLLQRVDARVRLLVILSDGKPEDYDDYKGEYAIEDTRHALIESRVAGIHPFCITIDQHDHDYLAHMYGKNYIFINDIRKLPARMPEIYRVLTS